ncbi:tail fiber protein [Yersinia frederiksenii]|nr:tail fiber protein [Yersinia frederiksenii]CNI51362.1 tail fiber protein [Yersinia frederiksenii]HDL7738220.1 hypothetical protein [Yersinia enterocolitica]
MHRIDTPSAQIDKFGVGKNGFTRGNPQIGVPATALDDDYFDAIQEEIAGVVESTGVVLDKSNRTQLLTALKKLFLRTSNNFSEIAAAGSAAVTAALANLGLSDVAHLPQLTGVIGTSRNARMSVTAASATATFTADELIVQTALGGLQYKLSSFSKTVNLATTGAGGMDTGTVPGVGYVALYAIYNPTSGVSALLAVNATSARAPEVYGGANMPAGYTASALVSVWRTATSQFVIGIQIGRKVKFATCLVLASSIVAASYTSLSISSFVPINATYINGNANPNISGSGNSGISIASSSGGFGEVNIGSGSSSISVSFADVIISTPQTIYYTLVASVSLQTSYINITGYEI